MKISLFDPRGIKAENYRSRYPELDRVPEFSDLLSKALIFVWWYANPTSPLVIGIPDDYERVQEALRMSTYTPSKTEKENILKLQFNSSMAVAIKKMSEFDPGARYKGYKMIKTIFDHYEKLIEQGPDAFIATEGSGNKAVTYIDYPRYVTTSAKIAEEIPSLLAKLEEGFGIVDISGKQKDGDEGASSIRDWHMSKEDNND
jgi:hypothetical protein